MTRLDPSYRCLLEIYMKILRASLDKELYSARIAGLDWTLISTHYGIIVRTSIIPQLDYFAKEIQINLIVISHLKLDVYGFDDKLPLLVERIIKKFSNYKTELDLNEQLFLDTKKEVMG